MTECESRSAGSRKGWKCQLVRGHPGPHQNDAWDSLDEWKDPEPPSPSDTTEQVRKPREALEPFATFAENYVNPKGWNDVGIGTSHERIVDWFGPSDFRQARTALAEGETPVMDSIDKASQLGQRLSGLYAAHAEWSQVAFGTDEKRGPLGPLEHLVEEAKEAYRNPGDISEYADCFLLVLDAARRAGFNLSLLIDAASTKLALNKTREWSKAKSMDHMVQHERTRTALAESEAGKVKAIRTCNKCGYVGPLVLHPPCPYMSCIVPEAVGTLDEALSQEVVLQKRIEELKGGLKAAWNVANLAANGNIKMKPVIAEQKERITELKRQLAADDLAFGHANTVIKKYMDDLSPSPCGVKGHYKVDWTDWTERRAGERRGNAVPGIEDRRKYGSGGSWLERRITSLRGHCGR